MIVSYHRNFIYIRTRKTASSTIETFLKQNLGPDDLYVSQGWPRVGSGPFRFTARAGDPFLCEPGHGLA
jgi:hypothetical protein